MLSLPLLVLGNLDEAYTDRNDPESRLPERKSGGIECHLS